MDEELRSYASSGGADPSGRDAAHARRLVRAEQLPDLIPGSPSGQPSMAARVIPVTSPKSNDDEQNIQLPCRCDAPLKARSDEPCPVHQDVTFDAESVIKAAGGAPRLDAIAFRNHYVASISVMQRQARPDGLVWVAVLREKHLMRDAHCEDDAQSSITLETSDFTNFDPSLCGVSAGDDEGLPVGSLRFRLRQPSPTWKSYELKHLKCLMRRVS